VTGKTVSPTDFCVTFSQKPGCVRFGARVYNSMKDEARESFFVKYNNEHNWLSFGVLKFVYVIPSQAVNFFNVNE
jgi:hypothetical protein